MKYNYNVERSLTCFLICALTFGSSINATWAANAASTNDTKREADKLSQSSKAETRLESTEKVSATRKQVLSESVSALRETQDSLKALDEGKNKEALASLEKATGKLEIVLAREPKLGLVPIDVRVSSSDVYASIETVKAAKQQVEKLLNDGHMQEARAILQTLTSEALISTTNLPMATYPPALKKAAKLIDEGKTGEAKEVLQTALDTLVTTDVIIPLPVVRAKACLVKAEALAKMNNRTAQQNKDLETFLGKADKDIETAEILGYGQKADFDSFYKEIESIRAKTNNGKAGKGFFESIRSYMESMTKYSQHANGDK